MDFEFNKNEITENELLDHTLELLEQQGAPAARAYLEANQQNAKSTNRVQIENYRCCLAAVCGEKEAALHILRTAVIDEGYWYRPEVFYDEDLQSLWEEPQFKDLKEISSLRYQNALNNSTSYCTWNRKKTDNLLLALHGNQETLNHAAAQWAFLASDKLQVEYLQSGEPDCYDLYRWEADGPGAMQLCQTLESIGWDNYHGRILAGFSAGCNVITRAVAEENISCSKMILVAPWLPTFAQKGYEALCNPLKGSQVLIICGEQDNDCLPLAEELMHTLVTRGIACTLKVIPRLGHGFPDSISELVIPWLQ